MTDVAVVFPPLRVSRDFIDYPYFADLGAVQAAAVLRAAGKTVALAHGFALGGATLAPRGDGYVLLGASVPRVLAAIPREAGAILVAFTPFHRPPARDPVLAALLEELRRARPETPIVLADLYQSGQHVVDARPADTLAAYPEADVFVRYEAEDLLAPLLDELTRRGRPAEARAIDGGEPAPLDALPLPAWDLVDMPRLFAFHEDVVRGLGRPAWAFPIDGRSAPAVTSRGCPYRCVHCSSNPTSRREGKLVAPKTQRRYSPEYLDRLFADLRGRGVRRVHLLDELINVNERHFDAVMALLEKHDLAFEVPNGMRADYLLPPHLATMKGRLTTLSVSAESGVQRVVDEVVDKRLDLRAIGAAARGAAAAGVPMLVHFMIGLPGETKAEINGTLAFARDLREETGAFPSVQFATPLPGTRLAALGRERGRVLPLIQDFGPHFQQSPSMETAEVSLAELGRFKQTFDRRLAAAEAARTVILSVTHRCNNRCSFCATGTRAQLEGDLEQQQGILATERRRGARRLSLDGGEPTLADHLFALIASARRLGYTEIGLITNGRRASYTGYAARLVRSGLTSIRVSLHGPDQETHTEIVGDPDAFAQTCGGLRELARLAPPGLQVSASVTVTRSNHDKLAALADLVVGLGVRRLEVRALNPFGPGTGALAPDPAAAATAIMRLIDACADRLEIQVRDLPPCSLPGYERHLVGDELALDQHVVYRSTEGVDLLAYLRARKVKKPVCAPCPEATFCSGFWDVDGAPDPGWLLPATSLLRPAGAARLAPAG